MNRARLSAVVLTVTIGIVFSSLLAHAQEAPAAQRAESSKKPSDRVVIKVGTTQVTEAEFESRIGDIESQGEGENEALTEKERRRLADDYASVLMLAQRATADHLDTSPEISRKLAVARLQILSDAAFASLMDRAKPGAQEIRGYYDSHPAEFDEVQIRRLFIWKRAADTQNQKGLPPEVARQRADQILEASTAGRDASKLIQAFQNSNDGLLDMAPIAFPRDELPPAVEKVAFAMTEGKWAEAQDTRESLMLVNLVKRDRQPLAEVSSIISKRLQTQTMKVQLDELKKKSGIWMDEKYFANAEPPAHGTSRNSNALSKHQEASETEETNEHKQQP